MKAKLLVVGSDVKAAEINLKLPVVIGRGRKATLTLPHPLVSREHCELYELDGQLMVRDLGSLNGTYVGNQRVTEAVVPPGELLTVATINFRAVYSASDDTHSGQSFDLGNDDSTHGVHQPKPRATVDNHSGGSSEVPIPPPPPGAITTPVERDTEWQVGNSPLSAESENGDDLSSLLRDHDT